MFLLQIWSLGQGYQALEREREIVLWKTSRTRLLRARCILFFLAAVLYTGLSSQWMSTPLPLTLRTVPGHYVETDVETTGAIPTVQYCTVESRVFS
jgi:hypothetical protein